MTKKVIYWIGGLIFVYVAVVLVFYLNQERFGFNPKKLPQNHVFQCDQDFEELTVTSFDGTKLHGVLVKADSAKGLILYLHGSGGSIDKYMEDAPIYASFGYDVFLLDYRGYGKSEGNMINEKQFTDDLDIIYASMKERYEEKNIVIMGFSMGTFAASYLASKNNPKLLVLEAPLYWIQEQYIKKFFFLPVKILAKYKFETYKYVKATEVQIALFLGRKDHLSSETRWPQVLKPNDIYIILENAGHQNFAGKELFMEELRELL
jgi:alpha-beta hydrolase superfamily lysophospholipase